MKHRRLCCILAILMFVLTCPMYVEASEGINSYEQEVMSFANETFEVDGKYYELDSSYVNQLYNYLNQEQVELSASKKASLVSKGLAMIPQGVSKGYLSEVDEKDVNDYMCVTVDGEEKSTEEMVDDFVDLAQDLNLGVNVDPVTKKVSVVENSGKVILDNTDVIKATGFSYGPTTLIVIGIFLLLLACVAACYRFRMFTSEEEI